jgi:hypothetical protein
MPQDCGSTILGSDYTSDTRAIPLMFRIPSDSLYGRSASPFYNAALISTSSQNQTCIVKGSTLYVQGASFDKIGAQIVLLVIGDGESFLFLLSGIFQLCLSRSRLPANRSASGGGALEDMDR